MDDQLPVDKVVPLWLARRAQKNVRFGSFVCKYRCGGAIGEAAILVNFATSSEPRKMAYQMMIIRKDDSTWGNPNTTLVMTGQNSEKDPAGSRYTIVFFRLSNTTRPY